MEPHNLDIIVFSEYIRKEMQRVKPPLIRFRRPLLKGYPSVFTGYDATAWAMKTMLVIKKTHEGKEENDSENCNTSHQLLSEKQACSLYQKLMDAGLLKNVTTQEEFKKDRSLFRFSSDDLETEKLIRTVAIGYRLYDSAQCSCGKMFQKVCSLGQLVSCECLKSRDIVDWLVDNELCPTREAGVAFGQDMREFNVIKPVDADVLKFTDGSAFYIFELDFKRPRISVQQFLDNNIVYDHSIPASDTDQPAPSRNKRIHLRQTSDQLMDMSHLSLMSQTKLSLNGQKGVSTLANGFKLDSDGTESLPTYQSLLNHDGSVTKEALMHPSAPYKKKDVWVYPDPVGYGFVVRGSGPCFIKIVDPDSPAGKAGLKASQYIMNINGNDVMGLPHTGIEDLILNGPKHLKITIMQTR